MVVVRAILYGNASAALAGLLVALGGLGLGLSETQIVVAAAPTGVLVGTLCFSLALLRPVAARVRRRH